MCLTVVAIANRQSDLLRRAAYATGICHASSKLVARPLHQVVLAPWVVRATCPFCILLRLSASDKRRRPSSRPGRCSGCHSGSGWPRSETQPAEPDPLQPPAELRPVAHLRLGVRRAAPARRSAGAHQTGSRCARAVRPGPMQSVAPASMRGRSVSRTMPISMMTSAARFRNSDLHVN